MHLPLSNDLAKTIIAERRREAALARLATRASRQARDHPDPGCGPTVPTRHLYPADAPCLEH
jgi:hypothetical protein